MYKRGFYFVLLFLLLGFIVSGDALTRVKTKGETLDKHSKGHRCIHDEVAKINPPAVIEVKTKSGSSNKRAPSNPQNIRILFDLSALDDPNVCTSEGQSVVIYGSSYTCTADDVLTQEKRDFLTNTMIPYIEGYFENTLAVDPVNDATGIQFVSNKCSCANITSNTGTITGQDLVIFVHAYSTQPKSSSDGTSSTIAFACQCLADIGGRPLAGIIDFGPNEINLDPGFQKEQLGVGIHEITHVLGFSSSKYSFYPTGTSSTKFVTIADSRQVRIMSTPNVAAEAQRYFNCSTLEGLELEDGGGSGTSGSHWERRLVMNEYMTGYSSGDPIVSNFTLNLFVDMGWYAVNFSNAGQLSWGQGEGCAFATGKCTARSPPYFCDIPVKIEEESCTWDGRKKGICNVVQYSAALDEWSQSFSDPTYGGDDDLADFCPFFAYRSEYSGDCTVTVFNDPTRPDYYATNNFGEHFCESCRCISVVDDEKHAGGGCYNFTCVNGNPKVRIGLIWYDCESDGQEITVDEIGGKFYCPTPKNKWCSEVPSQTDWPEFVSVDPTTAQVGDTVTITGTGFNSSDATAYFGSNYACDNSTLEYSTSGSTVTITCVITNADSWNPTLRGIEEVDVVIIDAYQRTAVGLKALKLSSANHFTINFSLITLAILVLVKCSTSIMTTMWGLLLTLLVASTCAIKPNVQIDDYKFDPATTRVASVKIDKNKRIEIFESFSKDSAATGTFDDTLNITGWGVLKIETSSGYADLDQMYAAGFVEGFLTHQRIYENYQNMYAYFFSAEPPSESLLTWMDEQESWVRSQISSPWSVLTDYWKQVALIMAQFDGLVDGYNKATNTEPLDVWAFQMLNGVGDLLDLISATTPQKRIQWKNLTPSEFRRTFAANGHCSALVKLTGDFSDMFSGHSSWFTYGAMNRIYKHYNFDLTASFVAAHKMSFSSYPGFLESLDDFYIMDSGLVMLQTTNSIFNTDLYELVVPQSLLAWQRVKLANTMANSGQEWSNLVALYNSGTYNNQYMVIDYKKFTPGQLLPHGVLWVVEQIPGLVEFSDETSQLERGYWPSYNVPFFETIYNLSGYPEIVEQYGVEYSYQLAPRAQIFRRDQSGVVDLETFKGLLRYNDYENDPYSGGDPGNAICSRFDLESVNPGAFGCYDTKVTSYSLQSQLISHAINGPTTSGNLPPYVWTNEFDSTVHEGQPTEFDFHFVTMDPDWS